MRNYIRYTQFVILTFAFFILSMWVSLLPHEYAHSFVAWIYGYKSNPFNIHYGELTWQNIIFIHGINENVNYFLMNLRHDYFAMGLAAFAGPGIATVSIYILSLFLLRFESVKRHPYLFYFLCWVNVINLAELISYFVVRIFVEQDDSGLFEYAWGISPWIVFIVGIIILYFGVKHLYNNLLKELYLRLQLKSVLANALILLFFTFVLFGHVTVRIYLSPSGRFANVVSVIFSIIAIALIIFYWPKRHLSSDNRE
ncbi:hypothetical protein AYO45_02185 [Gammaproteobacteria bacterium SCGC AG-212-F23]|nr:hypothetical protein AYO45_02185 [Gammaproteobacteria bacterium SCGC AG-212-F23]